MGRIKFDTRYMRYKGKADCELIMSEIFMVYSGILNERCLLAKFFGKFSRDITFKWYKQAYFYSPLYVLIGLVSPG